MAIKRSNFSYAAPDEVAHSMLTVGEAGGIVCFTNSNNFTGDPDDPDNQVGYVASPTYSGGDKDVAAGVLMMTTKNYNPAEVPDNEQDPFTVVIGSKVWVQTGGYVETDMVESAVLNSIVPGPAYLGTNGKLTNVENGIPVGRFGSSADSDGFVKFHVNVNK